MKKIIVAICVVIITALLAAGCVNEPDVKVEPVALAKKAPEAPSLLLGQVLADNSAALSFAGDKTDFLAGDRFLDFVDNAKDRDAAEHDKEKARALQAAVDQAQAILNSQTPSSAPTQANQTGSGPQSGGSSGGGHEPVPPPAPKRHYNTAAGYSIIFPAGWTEIETTAAGTPWVGAVSGPDRAGDQFAENIGVCVDDLPLPLRSEEYLGLVENGLKATSTDFKELELSDYTLDGKAGRKLVFSFTTGGGTLTEVIYAAVSGLKAYVIIGAAQSEQYSNYSGAFDACAGTFKFESSP